MHAVQCAPPIEFFEHAPPVTLAQTNENSAAKPWPVQVCQYSANKHEVHQLSATEADFWKYIIKYYTDFMDLTGVWKLLYSGENNVRYDNCHRCFRHGGQVPEQLRVRSQ